MKFLSSDNEVVQFLINFFLIEVVGQSVVFFLQFLFRLFGMPQLYVFCHTTPYFHQIVFTVLLVVAVAISVASILKRRK